MKTAHTPGGNTARPPRIGAARFKAQCLALLDRLGPDGLVITKHGKPVARVLPYDPDPASLIGSLRHELKIRGDIMSTGIRWDSERQAAR